MTSNFSIPIRFALVGLAVGIAAFAQEPVGTAGRKTRMDGEVHRAQRNAVVDAQSAARHLRTMTETSRRHRLGRLTASEATPLVRKPGLTPVGVNRAIPSAAAEAQAEWSVTAVGKRVWRLALQSEGAEAVRVRFTNFHAGQGKVWVLGANDSVAGPYSNDGPFGDGEFWSDMVEGDSAVIAYEPADGAASTIPFTASELSHRFPAVSSKKADPVVRAATAATCTVDSSCYPSYSEPASAVALLYFESEGGSYQCSGTLISSASQPILPFLLTANHCISTAAEAKSVIAFFNYQTPSCNGTPPTLSRVPRVTGGSFVAGGAMTLGDFSLLQLTGFPNVDVKLMGWSASDISSNQQVTSISHPRGDFKRIALGQRTRDASVRFGDGDRMPANRNYQVNWSEGVTQGGSSGSPLLANLNGREYVIGTLTGGPDVDEDDSVAVCRASNLNATYGRFSSAYSSLAAFLTSVDGGASTLSQSTFSVAPLTLSSGQVSGQTTVSWRVSGPTRVQVRVDSPDGPEMTGFEGPTGSASTGDWVREGTIFYLQNASDGSSAGAAKTIATARAQVSTPLVNRTGFLTASQNPVVVGVGETAGAVTLTWRTTGVTQVQIRIGSPTGPAMTGFDPANGSTTTGPWVTDGMVFYLQDASDGSSLGASRTLTALRVRVSRL